MSKYLTIAEVAELSELPNSTCRRYLASFESFFLIKGGSRLKKYEAGAVNVLKRIKGLYEDGLDTNEIYTILVNEFPLVITDGEEQKTGEETSLVPTLATSEDIAEIKESLEQQKQFNEMLLKKLDEQNAHIQSQNAYIKESLERRDKQLMESMRITMELKQARIESATSQQKGLFARLFGK